MRKQLLILMVALLSTNYYSQSYTQLYQDRANLLLQSNINTLLTEFANLGVKTTGSSANNNAFTWLQDKYVSYGYATSTTATDLKIESQSFTYNGKTSKNIIVTKKGTKYPDTYVIICGHYDTIVGPGVNDNGSGVAIILEMARLLKNVPTEYSIKFINFSGEEQGLLGSQAYVTNIVNGTTPKMNIRLVFNLDEVGGVAGANNNKIYCEKDGTPTQPTSMASTYATYPSTNNAASNTFNTILMNCFTLYNNGAVSPVTSYIERSDYMPFDKNNDVSIGLYEYNQSSHPHKSTDTYANMDPIYVYNVGKVATAAVQHFAVATTSTLGTENIKPSEVRLSLFPNPVQDYLYLGINEKEFDISIFDGTGKLVHRSKNNQMINVSSFSNGMYILHAQIKGEKVSEKFIVKK